MLPPDGRRAAVQLVARAVLLWILIAGTTAAGLARGAPLAVSSDPFALTAAVICGTLPDDGTPLSGQLPGHDCHDCCLTGLAGVAARASAPADRVMPVHHARAALSWHLPAWPVRRTDRAPPFVLSI